MSEQATAATRRRRFPLIAARLSLLVVVSVVVVVVVALVVQHRAQHVTLPTGPPLVTVIGDSYSGGSPMNSGPETLWSSRVSERDGVRIQLLTAGGSGYVTANQAASSKTTFVQRAALVDPAAREVVFFGSRNDTRGDVYSAAIEALTTAAERAPAATLVVIGPVWVDDDAPTLLKQHRDDLRRAASDRGASFVDPIADRWFPTGSGLIGADGVHPTDAGHQHLADLIGPVITAHLSGAL